MTSATANELAHDKMQSAIAQLHVMENLFEVEGAADKLPALTIADALTGIRRTIEEANTLFGQK